MNDAELAQLPVEELVAYIVKGRASGNLPAAVTAAKVLAWSYERRITAFVYTKIGDLGEPVCDEVIERTLESAIKSVHKFEGATPEEFGGWIFTIARRRIDDMHRERSRRVKEVPTTRPGTDGEDFETDHATEDPHEALDATSVLGEVYVTRNAAHKLVIRLGLFERGPGEGKEGLSHIEIADEVGRQLGGELDDPMTDQNVAKILSRFRRDVRKALDNAEDPTLLDEDDDDSN